MTTTRKPLPPMARIRQSFARPRVEDAAAEMTAQMELLAPRIKAGSSVGITVGSRGIQNICAMLEAAIAVVRRCGATPVLLSAMGSHGGGTPEGQKEVLDSLNITEERLGAKVVTCATCRSIGQTPDGLTAHMLDSAFSVDAIIPINRVKTHTSFKGCVESGMCKMLVVGLGGPGGAGQFHSLGQSELPRLLVDVSRIILQKMPVIGGIAIVENAYEETARIQALLTEEMIEREVELLTWSKTLMPALPVDRLHGLIVEEMGKNFSGTGVDTNIIGRLRIQGEAEMTSPSIRYVSVLDLSDESHGNATGIGLVDFATQRLIDKVDRKATYLNNLTTTFVTRAFLPTWYDTEQEALETMMFCLRSIPQQEVRLVHIPNTLYLTDCLVSEAVLQELVDTSRFSVVHGPRPVLFDAEGRLADRIGRPHQG